MPPAQMTAMHAQRMNIWRRMFDSEIRNAVLEITTTAVKAWTVAITLL